MGNRSVGKETDFIKLKILTNVLSKGTVRKNSNSVDNFF